MWIPNCPPPSGWRHEAASCPAFAWADGSDRETLRAPAGASGNRGQRLDIEFLREFLEGQNRKLDGIVREQAAHMTAHIHRGEDDRRDVGGVLRQRPLDFGDQGLRIVIRKVQECAGRCALHRVSQDILGRALQDIGSDDVVAAGGAEADLALQGCADIFRQQDDVLFALAPFDQGFEDQAQIADRYVFADEPAKHLRDFLQRHDFLRLPDQIRIVRLHV